jgi:GMP reductase
MISTGIGPADWEKLGLLVDRLDPHFVCVDVANGYSQKFADFAAKVHEAYPKITIVAGNVVTREMAEDLILYRGVDICKIGIGSGSVCRTRIQTDVGYPQLSAVMECSDAAHGLGGHIISDGGAKCAGDVSKAFGGGADFVMLGSMFAGHDESGGELKTEEKTGEQYKLFYGMSSTTAMEKYHGGVASYRSSEGKTVKTKYKGPVEGTIQSIMGGIRSACTYVGAHRLKDLPKCTTFVRVNRQVSDAYGSRDLVGI